MSTAQQIKAKSRITLHSSTCHSQSQQHNMRETHSLSTGPQLSAVVMCLQYRTCERSRLKRLLSTKAHFSFENKRERLKEGQTDRRQMKVQSKKIVLFCMGGYTAIFKRMSSRNTYIMNKVDLEVFELRI